MNMTDLLKIFVAVIGAALSTSLIFTARLASRRKSALQPSRRKYGSGGTWRRIGGAGGGSDKSFSSRYRSYDQQTDETSRILLKIPSATRDRLPLEERIAILNFNLIESKSLLDEVAKELEDQTERIKAAREEVEHSESLATTHQVATEAIHNIVESAMRHVHEDIEEDRESDYEENQKRNRWQQWAFFLAGLVASAPIGIA